MTDYGVISTGFLAKSLQNLLTEIEQEQRAAFGSAINTQADSVLGQLNGIFADKLAEIWEVLEAIYRSRQPDYAIGDALDNIAALTGTIRLPETRSRADLKLNIDNGVTVSTGKIVSIGPSGAQWQTIADVTNATGFNATLDAQAESVEYGPITGNPYAIDTIKTPVAGWSAKAAIDSINSDPFYLVDGETLLIEIDQASPQTVTFNAGDFVNINAATAQEVIDAIVADIPSGIAGLDVAGTIRLTSALDGSGSSLRIVGGTGADALGFSGAIFKGFNPDDPAQSINGIAEPYNLTDGWTLSVKIDDNSATIITFSAGDFVNINAATAREVAKVINAALSDAIAYVVVDKIQIESDTTGVNGSIEVIGGLANIALQFQEQKFIGSSKAAIRGRNTETDSELRLRREKLLRLPGSSTIEAIRSALLNTLDVLQAFVFENPTNIIVDGMPPHSLEAVVSGGEDQDVAQTIFNTKPIGIQTHRDPGPDGVTVAILDSQSVSHDINFSRPTEIRMYIEIDLDVKAAQFGGGDQIAGEEQTKNILKDLGDLQQIGDDLIVLRFACAPFGIAGVVDVTSIKIDSVSPPVNTANITIANRELATFSTADMTVNVSFV